MRKRGRKYFTLIIALVFSWLTIGSLVDFHRAHIFGKGFSFEWAFLKPKTDEPEYQFAATDNDPGVHPNNSDISASCFSPLQDITPCSRAVISRSQVAVATVMIHLTGAAPLRAPPFAC